MVPASFSASAPGKLMLMGEHAVLHGRQALVCAVNRRLLVRIQPRDDRQIVIDSALGRCCVGLDDFAPAPPFEFVLAALARRRRELPGGCTIAVEADFGETLGLGSSSAVTVAATAALHAWLGQPFDLDSIFTDSLAAVRAVQGRGSGADVAASVHGGLVLYRAEPLEVRKLATTHPLAVVYSGGKEKTTGVVAMVEAARQRERDRYDGIYDRMDECVQTAVAAIDADDWPAVGRQLDVDQGLMVEIGVSNARLAAIVEALRQCRGILGAKISGAGLGDCVVGLGQVDGPDFPYRVLDAAMTDNGVRRED